MKSHNYFSAAELCQYDLEFDVQIMERNFGGNFDNKWTKHKVLSSFQTRPFKKKKKSLDINRINVKSISQMHWFGHKNVSASLHFRFIFVLYSSL